MTLIDADARHRLTTDLDSTFFVEAGAGTGKTRTLVERIVALVAAGRVRMETLAAITFTEAAAAELRDRVREYLERAAADAARDEAERERCAVAALEVDLAAIQTIHSFCGTLLRTFPVEAGLPPGFATWDTVQRDMAFEDAFRAWLYDEAPRRDRPALREAVRRGFALGLTPEHLYALALRFQDHYDLLQQETTWDAPTTPDARVIAQRIGAEILALETYVPFARLGEVDPLVREIRRLALAADRLVQVADEEGALSALQRFLSLSPKTPGNMTNWNKETSGENPVRVIKATLKAAKEDATSTVDAHRTAAFAQLLVHLRDFTLAQAAHRKRLGVATFQDLLTWARDLLRDRPDVRRRAHARWERLFVDEFQDTDPLQAEITWFLAADPAQAEERDWRALRLVPGRLFLVGDPKQSIYRFRRADIAIYSLVYDRLAELSEARRESLVQNFRSVAPVLRWVNAELGREMQPSPGVQPEYADLHPRPAHPTADIAADRCGVYHVGGLLDGAAADRWAMEAEDVALTARRAVEEGWLVTAEENGARVLRSVAYGDICVLMPARTNLRAIERSLEDAGVPYRVDGGSLVLDSPEVRDLLSCLRAIDDPSDQVALVAALRSPAFACSDSDLLSWVEAGGALDYIHPTPADKPDAGCDGPVRNAFKALRALHEKRTDRPAAVTVEQLVRERMLGVGVFAHRRPREAWRRLRYVVAQARALAGGGQPTLRSLLDWLDTLQSRRADSDGHPPEGDEDAVRLMTVHGAKGLEFPVVLLTGLGAGGGGRTDSIDVIANYESGTLQARCGVFRTVIYEEEHEKLLLEAEKVRLLYVATTRARDHLVLSLHHTVRETSSSAARILKALEDAPEPLSTFLTNSLRPPVIPSEARDQSPRAQDDPSTYIQQEETWLAARTAKLASLAEERVVPPTGLARHSAPVDDEPLGVFLLDDPEEGRREAADAPAVENEVDLIPACTPLEPWRAAIELGRAVHFALQSVDLVSLSDLQRVSAWAARKRNIPEAADEIERLALAAARSPTVRRAIAAGRYWREVPIGVEIDGVLLEGQIDLLFEHPDGTLGVIDYKTDAVDADLADERAAHYELEGGAYALAVERVTGRSVTSVEFVFAALEGARVSYDEAAARRLAEEARLSMRG